MKNESSHRLFLGLHGNCVFKCAGYYISAASHNRLKGAGAALEIDDLDIKAFIFEITKLFGNGQRQVVVEAFPPTAMVMSVFLLQKAVLIPGAIMANVPAAAAAIIVRRVNFIIFFLNKKSVFTDCFCYHFYFNFQLGLQNSRLLRKVSRNKPSKRPKPFSLQTGIHWKCNASASHETRHSYAGGHSGAANCRNCVIHF